MKSLIQDFPKQLRTGLDPLPSGTIHSKSGIENIVVAGMGGSAFGAEVIKNYINPICKLSFTICRDYTLPAFVSPKSLVIISSYSGNTEETLASMNSAYEKGAKVVCISSGGKVLEMAKEKNLDFLTMPSGFPPRAAVGYSIARQLQVLEYLELIPPYKKDLEEAIRLIEDPELPAAAFQFALGLKSKPVIIYSSQELEASAIRWRQQIEENAKHIAFHHTIPEMNHNELVGWRNPGELLKHFAVVFLRSSRDYERNRVRMDINKEILSAYTEHIFDFESKGDSNLARNLYLVHAGDWVSLKLAELNGVDPLPVDVINYLKSELEKFSA